MGIKTSKKVVIGGRIKIRKKKQRKISTIVKMCLTMVIFVIVGSLFVSVGSRLTLILIIILVLITFFLMLKYFMELIKTNKIEKEMKDSFRVISGGIIGMGTLALYISLSDFNPDIYEGIFFLVIGFILLVIVEFQKENK